MERTLIMLGALAGFAAVVAGTFAAHVLDPQLAPKMRDVFETGVRYQMYHALAIIASGWLCGRGAGGRLPAVAGSFFVVGIVFFSGSLYLLALTGAAWWGMIAPIGGSAFLVGWAVLIVAAVRQQPSVSRQG